MYVHCQHLSVYFDPTLQSESGVSSRIHRCMEQLVLVAKAIAVLESGLRRYRIEQATADVSSLEDNTSLHMKRGSVQNTIFATITAHLIIAYVQH